MVLCPAAPAADAPQKAIAGGGAPAVRFGGAMIPAVPEVSPVQAYR